MRNILFEYEPKDLLTNEVYLHGIKLLAGTIWCAVLILIIFMG